MASSPLVTRAQELSQKVRAALDLLPDDEPLDLSGEPTPASSFLFEMVVYHDLLLALQNSGWKLTAVNGADKHRFAQAPGLKANFTDFKIARDQHDYQLVHGTAITDRYGEPRAPDISLQTGDAPDAPCGDHVIAVWDAKLRGSSGGLSKTRISDGEFRSFLSVVKWIPAPSPGDCDEVLDSFPVAFQVRGLITNGQRPSEPDEILRDEKVSICEAYVSSATPCLPSRKEQLSP